MNRALLKKNKGDKGSFLSSHAERSVNSVAKTAKLTL